MFTSYRFWIVIALIVVAVGAYRARGPYETRLPFSVAELSSADVKEIFLGAKTSVGGGDVEPVLAKSGAAHDAFLKAYVGKSDQGLANHFKSLVFTGKGSMPKAFATDAEIVKYVVATKGAIGYISGSADAGARSACGSRRPGSPCWWPGTSAPSSGAAVESPCGTVPGWLRLPPIGSSSGGCWRSCSTAPRPRRPCRPDFASHRLGSRWSCTGARSKPRWLCAARTGSRCGPPACAAGGA